LQRAGRANADYLMSLADIEAFEAKHGRIRAGQLGAMRTDWSHHWSLRRDARLPELRRHRPAHAGPSAEAVRFLVEQRGVLGFGSETIGTDAGQAAHLLPPYPCHTLMHGAGKYGLQCLAHLEQLPPTGALIVAAPLEDRTWQRQPAACPGAGGTPQ
jgi:kynurenine formamidase